MPVETATTINQLVPANPVHTDGLSQADSHMRLIKQTLQNTFPNVSGVVSATDTDLSNTAGLFTKVSGTVTAAAPPTGTTFGGQLVLKGVATNTDIALVNTTSTLQVFSQPAGTTIFGVDTAGNATAAASVNAPIIKQAGNPLVPSGVIVMWSGSIASIPAGWHLCDGTNGTPNLINLFVTGAGPGGNPPGTTGGAVSATATTSTAGTHSHGGVTGVVGAHSHGGNTVAYSLTINDLPPHGHTVDDPGHFHWTEVSGSVGSAGGVVAQGAGGVGVANTSTNGTGISLENTGSGFAHAHIINPDNAHQHTIAADGAHAHSVTVQTVPPYYALAFIQKL